MAYSQNVIENVQFLGDEAAGLADQEIERARGLDTKAAALIAGSLVIVAAGATFASTLAGLHGGSGAKALWAVEFGLALILVMVAGLFGVLAMRPRAFRTAIAYHELQGWVTPAWLDEDPTYVRGKILRANVQSVGHARDQNDAKSRWLAASFNVFALALVCIVALSVSIAVHASLSPTHSAATTSIHAVSRTTSTVIITSAATSTTP